jgi:hypothetical protein
MSSNASGTAAGVEPETAAVLRCCCCYCCQALPAWDGSVGAIFPQQVCAECQPAETQQHSGSNVTRHTTLQPKAFGSLQPPAPSSTGVYVSHCCAETLVKASPAICKPPPPTHTQAHHNRRASTTRCQPTRRHHRKPPPVSPKHLLPLLVTCRSHLPELNGCTQSWPEPHQSLAYVISYPHFLGILVSRRQTLQQTAAAAAKRTRWAAWLQVRPVTLYASLLSRVQTLGGAQSSSSSSSRGCKAWLAQGFGYKLSGHTNQRHTVQQSESAEQVNLFLQNSFAAEHASNSATAQLNSFTHDHETLRSTYLPCPPLPPPPPPPPPAPPPPPPVPTFPRSQAPGVFTCQASNQSGVNA